VIEKNGAVTYKKILNAKSVDTRTCDYIIIFAIPAITASIEISKGTEANDGGRGGGIGFS